eukprot:c45882_g1_i1 orf=141-365(+)
MAFQFGMMIPPCLRSLDPCYCKFYSNNNLDRALCLIRCRSMLFQIVPIYCLRERLFRLLFNFSYRMLLRKIASQ